MGWTAQGLEAVIGDTGIVIEKIVALSAEYGVDKIVVGYPLNMDGTVGKRAQITDNFISELSGAVTCPIIKWDERLTSVSAGRAMREVGMSASRNKEKVDVLSAMIMLQSYLDSAENRQVAINRIY